MITLLFDLSNEKNLAIYNSLIESKIPHTKHKNSENLMSVRVTKENYFAWIKA